MLMHLEYNKRYLVWLVNRLTQFKLYRIMSVIRDVELLCEEARASTDNKFQRLDDLHTEERTNRVIRCLTTMTMKQCELGCSVLYVLSNITEFA